MKKVVSGDVLKKCMRSAINLLSDTVKTTLGPKGCNVIIDSSNFSPFITNDGVTIAENIESENPIINSVLEIAKEASIVTNKVVGDGTTTTLIILQNIFNLSLDLIDNGVNPIILKKELNEKLYNILDLLELEKFNLKDDVIYNIAKVAGGDNEIARVVGDVFLKIPYRESVSIREVSRVGVNVNYYNGYKFMSILPSSLLLNDKLSLSYKDSCVLILNDVLSDLENISFILNDIFNSNKSLIIIANDFTSSVVEQIVSFVLNDELKCLLVKINDYGIRIRAILKDLEIISGANICNNEKELSACSLGVFKNVYVTKDNFRVDFNMNDNIKEYVLNIEKSLDEINDDYLKEFYFNRLSMFKRGTAEIEIGAFTKTELKEKQMRLEDALCAVYSSNDGVLVGGGVTLLKIANKLNEDNDVLKIWKEALKAPFKQLMINSGLEYENINSQIEKSSFNVVYNVFNESFEDINETYVLDSYKVVVNSIINACSIASMLITTNNLIINEHVNNLNKISEYGEI